MSNISLGPSVNDRIPFAVERGVNDAFKFNQETEFIPVLGLVSSQLNEPSKESKDSEEVKTASSIQNDHHPALLSLLANELSVDVQEIHDFELYASLSSILFVDTQTFCVFRRHLYDTQPSTLGGINNEFIFSPRMDNLVSSCVLPTSV